MNTSIGLPQVILTLHHMYTILTIDLLFQHATYTAYCTIYSPYCLITHLLRDVEIAVVVVFVDVVVVVVVVVVVFVGNPRIY